MEVNTLRFYGRRKGRKLPINKEKILKKNYDFVIKEPNVLDKNFSDRSKMNFLEIGFGNGENISNLAMKFPNINFFGAELFINSYIKLFKKILENDIKNIKIWTDDIRLIIDSFENEFFDYILILHPDPWKKKKHHKRRLIQQPLIEVFSRKLKKNARIILASDDIIMQSWILEQFHCREDFEWCLRSLRYISKKPKCLILSKYAQKAIMLKNNIRWFFYKKL